MPKVTQEHLDRRRQQILDAAIDCFARQGFHAASMQDIFAASGLSAGAVYRYFPSKGDLIRAISSEALEGSIGMLDAAIADASSGASAPSVADVIALLVGRLGEEPLARLRPVIVQIWLEAGIDPELCQLAQEVFAKFAKRFKTLLDLHAEAGRLPAGTDTTALARLMMATIQGYMVQYSIVPEPPMVDCAARAAFGNI
jgi:AcrR family transcriptional regulator